MATKRRLTAEPEMLPRCRSCVWWNAQKGDDPKCEFHDIYSGAMNFCSWHTKPKPQPSSGRKA